MEQTVVGIDESGRGPCIANLVVAGIKLTKEDEQRLKDLGVRDSKLLSPAKREILRKEIERYAIQIKLVVITAKQIDQMMQIMSLNDIEMNAMAQIINELEGDEIILDLPSNSPSFIPLLKSKLKNKNARLKAEHKADTNYISVGAASIIAKTERDRFVEELHKTYGDFGSGYPSDPRTVKFLKEYYAKHENLPDIVRHSWGTVEAITGKQFIRNGMRDEAGLRKQSTRGKQVNLFDY